MFIFQYYSKVYVVSMFFKYKLLDIKMEKESDSTLLDIKRLCLFVPITKNSSCQSIDLFFFKKYFQQFCLQKSHIL